MSQMKSAHLTNGLNRIADLIPTKPTEIKKSEGEIGKEGQASFKDVLNQSTASVGLTQPIKQDAKVDLGNNIKFSNHAIERMQSRGISYSPEDMTKLNQAVSKAAAKGSKDTLILMDQSALIVSIKNNTVVTVMDKNALKENVFTNIDSTIVI
ncbi:MAG: TIGR02530 family flagellar biosynthesis protein [Pseudobdellovibrio sp.]